MTQISLQHFTAHTKYTRSN